jgi:hypothetical protein
LVAAVAELRRNGVIASDASVREISGEIGEQRSQLGKYLDGFAAPAPAAANASSTPAATNPERPDALIELRKRLSVLEALRRCIG